MRANPVGTPVRFSKGVVSIGEKSDVLAAAPRSEHVPWYLGGQNTLTSPRPMCIHSFEPRGQIPGQALASLVVPFHVEVKNLQTQPH